MKKEEAEKLYPNVVFYGDVSIKDNVTIGDGTRIGEYVVIGANTKIGKNCRILYHVTISKDTLIGNNVFIGPNTTSLNDLYPPSKISTAPIIRDNVVIGGGVTIKPNVLIEQNVVVGAGSNVTHSIPANIVVVGNPARKLMTREEYDRKKARLEASVVGK